MKNYILFFNVNLILSFIFSFLNISINADISCFAFLLSFIFNVVFLFFSFKLLLKEIKYEKISVLKYFLQYEPFVFLISFILRRAGENDTHFIFDLVSLILWCILFILSYLLQRLLDPKRFNKKFDKKIPETTLSKKLISQVKSKKNKNVSIITYAQITCLVILEWIDAIIQAIFLVFLVQIFLFQLYKIPSESMVPEYMINDRVFVNKITDGPRFPLTNIGFPVFKEYKRGDIVVFRNPHYKIDRKSDVRFFMAQLVNMLTLTMVNINVDENGQEKFDPLVKRITGLPGEQLVMQDGILYSRTKDSNEFKPVSEDAKWAVYNFEYENPELQKMIQDIKISPSDYNLLLAIEEERNNLDVNLLKDELVKIAKSFEKYSYGINTASQTDDLSKMFNEMDMFEYKICSDYVNFSYKLLSIENGSLWFNQFLTSWIKDYEKLLKNNFINDSIYDDANYKLNLMFKKYLGNLVLISADKIYNQIPFEKWGEDSKLVEFDKKLFMLHHYVMYLDRRNMPIFPENDINGNPQYIPDNCYFMMGDNRFNSADMRHSDKSFIAKITPFDDYSLTYYSNIKPMYVQKKNIFGSAFFRFWPLNRPVRNN